MARGPGGLAMPSSLIRHDHFFNDTATTDFYTLSLHDALPISFRNRLLVICKNAYLFATMIMTSVSSPFSCCSGNTGHNHGEIGRAVQQECRDRSRMPSSA